MPAQPPDPCCSSDRSLTARRNGRSGCVPPARDILRKSQRWMAAVLDNTGRLRRTDIRKPHCCERGVAQSDV